jgi:hypothetical protein
MEATCPFWYNAQYFILAIFLDILFFQPPKFYFAPTIHLTPVKMDFYYKQSKQPGKFNTHHWHALR